MSRWYDQHRIEKRLRRHLRALERTKVKLSKMDEAMSCEGIWFEVGADALTTRETASDIPRNAS